MYRLGEVRDPGTAPPPGMRFSAAPDGAAFLELPGLARFLVRAGREVTVGPASECRSGVASVRALPAGSSRWSACSAISSCCMPAQWRLATGSSLFMGESGGRGNPRWLPTACGPAPSSWQTICCGSRWRTRGRRWRIPEMPTLKLLGDTLEHLGRRLRRLPRAWERAHKFVTSFPGEATETALPVARLYLLEHEPTAAADDFERMTGAAATMALVANSHGVKSLDVVGRRPRHFHDCMRLAGSVEIVRLKRRRNLADLPKTVAMLAQDLEP